MKGSVSRRSDRQAESGFGRQTRVNRHVERSIRQAGSQIGGLGRRPDWQEESRVGSRQWGGGEKARYR